MGKNYIRIPDEKSKPIHFNKQKYFFLLLPIGTATILLLCFNTRYYVTLHEFSWNRTRNYDFVDFYEKEYFIKTEGCKIPAFEPFDKSIIKYYHLEEPIQCHNTSNPPLVESDENSLWIVKKYYKNYSIHEEKQFRCCYQPFRRQSPEDDDSDDRYQYEKGCVIFLDHAKIHHEYVRVTCFYQEKEIYKDFHSFVVKNKGEKEINKSLDPKTNFSVLILGIDAVSRLNFHRTMPKTLNVLQDLNVLELIGYNKVADNTYPNLMPVLAGLSEEEIASTCYTQRNSTFDSCNFIWEDYKNHGFYTAFAEDAAPIGLFNYLKNGFSGTPTDFYWRTFNNLAIIEIGHEHRLNCDLCLGSRLSLDILLSYIKKFATVLASNPYFGFFWETCLTHDELNYPLLGDAKYANLLEYMDREDLLNDTVLILMSDHGIRWGEIRSTHQGRIEERMPFLFFVLPKTFKDKFPYAAYNLKKNTRRLTTPYDLHNTLLDLLYLDNITNKKIQERIENESYMNNRGISLFLPIHENRTCQSAAIDPHWCTCHQTRKLDSNSTIAFKLAFTVVKHINNLLTDYVQCAKLNLSQIIDITVGEPSYSKDMDSVNHVILDYTIVLQTLPGLGMFEATVRNTTSGWNITGTVSRINLYGKQSSCIDDFHLKLYCYCDNFIPNFNFFN